MLRNRALTFGVLFAAAMVSSLSFATQTLDEGLGLPDRFVVQAREAYVQPQYLAYTNSLLTVKPYDKWNGRADLPATGLVRWIDVGGTVNFRDIGGWNGLKTGRVYRGAEPNCQPRGVAKNYHDLTLNAAGVKTISETLRIKTDLDLRGRGESPTPDATPIPNAKLVRLSCGSYTNFLRDTKMVAKLLRVFAEPTNYPIYFHCYGGADRTGSLAFLLEGLCGASETDVCIDYELTSFSRIGQRTRCDKFSYCFASMMREMKTRRGKTLRDKIETYVRDECGLTQSEIATIRKMLCDEGK